MTNKLIERLEETAKTCRKRDPFEAHVKQKLEQAIERLRKLEDVREAALAAKNRGGYLCDAFDEVGMYEALADCGDES